MTQKQKLISHFKNGGKITSFEAYLNFGITQLATRIKELEEAHNLELNRVWITKNKKRFIQYSYDK